ncbi:DUF4238 domain-containing protein [Sandaracinobacter neustonicus]|uniref:DUF4238 domain-containing protein n=1 Tax=Sandaracinobacter neustonicus TaxID=1715348 RepID=A0A501XSY3_9SPHN|nr:DUF4238 domain-containing protein [Sandaracinobacter neustonicus]TPE63314.1 DUF4238 domain-containing protein [Sandaracinobacter neustonicus]
MSGKRQHYLPQFLLRRFGKSASKKVTQVRVIRLTRNYISSTENVGLEGHFYSSSDPKHAEIDKDITNSEGYFSDLASRAEANSESVDSREICELAAHLSIRSASIRHVFPRLIRELMDEIISEIRTEAGARRFIGMDTHPLPPEIKIRVSEVYDTKSDILKNIGISRHDFYLLCRRLLDENFSSIHQDIVKLIELFKTLPINDIVSSGHLDALLHHPVPINRIRCLETFSWKIVTTNSDLILPDCAVVGVDESGQFMPMVLIDNDSLRSVFFPLSRRRLAVGFRGSGFDIGDDILMSIASASCEYFVAHPTLQDAVSYAPAIGTGAKYFLKRELRRGIAAMLPMAAD